MFHFLPTKQMFFVLLQMDSLVPTEPNSVFAKSEGALSHGGGRIPEWWLLPSRFFDWLVKI